MAKRLATEYVNARLQLKHEEMPRFVAFMKEQELRLQVLALDNGNQELVLQDAAGSEEVRLTFQRKADRYACELSCRVVELQLTDALRKAVAAFKGNGIVNRIYSHYTMMYHYTNGAVRKIVENTASGERLVYEHKDTLATLERVFRRGQVEREIVLIQGAVNDLLDLRNRSGNPRERADIDERLKGLTQKLFALEA